jgi:uncharacterized protein YpmB
MEELKRSKGRPRTLSKWTRAVVLMPKDHWKKVKSEAARRGISASEYVRRLTGEALTMEE